MGGLVGAVLGPLVGGLLGKSSAKATNAANARAAEAANDFTREQMQNRHQWEVADLKKAGLNPVLSAGGTPSMGGSAVADVINPMDSMAKGVSSAVESARVGMEMKKLKSEIANIEQNTATKESEMWLNNNIGSKTVQDRKLTMLNQEIARQNASVAASNAASAKAAAAVDKARGAIEAEWYSGKTGRFSTAMDKLNPLKFFTSGK